MNKPTKIIFIILSVLAGLYLLVGGLLTLVLGDRTKLEEDHITEFEVDLDLLKTLPDAFYAHRRGNIYFEDLNLEKYRIWLSLDISGNVKNITSVASKLIKVV